MAPMDITDLPPEQVAAIAEATFGGNKGLNLGPIMLGCIFDCALYGLVMQQFQSWWTYSRDTERRFIGYLTYWVVLASTCWTGMIISYRMHNFVYRFGDYTVFLELPYVLAFPAVGAAISAPIQLFYTDRSYRLNNRNKFLLVLLCALVLGEIAMLAYGYGVYASTPIASELQVADMKIPIRAWQCFSVVTDVAITASIAVGLKRAQTGWVHTDALVKKLIFITLETQLAPTVIMISFLCQAIILPTSTMNIFFDVMLPKAYTVGYLATLNTRVRLSREMTSSGPSGNRNVHRPNTFVLGESRVQQGTVHVNTETHVESYNMGPIKGKGRINRDFEVDPIEGDSNDNLDYESNISNRDLHQPAQTY